MGPITSPDETIARIALYVGVPALTVVFLYTVYVIYQWFQAAIKGIEYAITAKDWWNNTIKGRLRSGSSSLGGILAGIILSHLLFFIGGVYLAQCFQFVLGISYADGQENHADENTLKLDEFVRMIAFKPLAHTSGVAATLGVIIALSIIDFIFKKHISIIPMFAVSVIGLVAAIPTGICVVVAALETFDILFSWLTAREVHSVWPIAVVYWAVGLAALPAGLSVGWILKLRKNIIDSWHDKLRDSTIAKYM